MNAKTANTPPRTDAIALSTYIAEVKVALDFDLEETAEAFVNHFQDEIAGAFEKGSPAIELVDELGLHAGVWADTDMCAWADAEWPWGEPVPFEFDSDLRLETPSPPEDHFSELTVAISPEDEGHRHGPQCYETAAMDEVESDVEHYLGRKVLAVSPAELIDYHTLATRVLLRRHSQKELGNLVRALHESRRSVTTTGFPRTELSVPSRPSSLRSDA